MPCPDQTSFLHCPSRLRRACLHARRAGLSLTALALLPLCTMLLPATVVGGSALVAGTVVALAGDARADDEPPAPAPEAPAAPEAAPPARAPLLPMAQQDPKMFKDLVEAARLYLNLEVEQWKGRTAFLNALMAQAEQKRYPLTDLAFLRWLTAQGRSFHQDMRESRWRRDFNISEYKSEGPFTHVKSEDFNLTFLLPKAYPSRSKDLEKYPRDDPFPTVMVLHEKDDYSGKKLPGVHALKRIWPKDEFEGLYEKWIAFVPVAAAGNYTEEDGRIRWEFLSSPFARFWKHYHVDFERVILDGGDAALAAAPALASWFAGIVLRDGQLTDALKGTVCNYATVPVFVVDKPALAKSLTEAGHPNVTLGKPGELLAWMEAQRRVTPKKFSWNVQRFDQVLPYWVNLDSPNFAAAERTLEVEVVDTAEAPNTVRIQARGIRELSLFLNDELVDLDRAVRVEINGHLMHNEIVPPLTASLLPIKRDLDLLFNRDPTKIRDSMFFGWLYPVRIVRLEVMDPKSESIEAPPPEAPAECPAATADEEQVAARLKEKAQMLIADGKSEDALPLLQRIVDMPTNAQHEWARARLAELKKSE